MSEGTSFNSDLEVESLNVNQENETLEGTKIASITQIEKDIYQDDESKVGKKDESEKGEEALLNKQEEIQEGQEDKVEEQEETAGKKPNLFEQEMSQAFIDYQEGDIIKGVVRAVEKNGLFLDIRYKSEGFIANSEFSFDESEVPSKLISKGDEVEAIIEKLETKQGYTLLSKKKLDHQRAWDKLKASSKTRNILNVDVVSSVKGGLVVSFVGIRGFIPASQVELKEDGELDHLVDQKLEVIVLQCDRKKKKVIFSNKFLKDKLNTTGKLEVLENLEIGDVKKGRVTSIKNFGAFVDLGGVEGLIHISELSWSRVDHPSDLLSLGEELDVFILGIDKDNEKISLGLKQLKPDPWVGIKQKFSIGQSVTGEVTRIVEFGAFVKLDEQIEGLVHISEITYDHVDKISDLLKVGDQVEATVKKLLPEEQKIGLSIKEAKKGSDEDQEIPEASKEISETEAAAETEETTAPQETTEINEETQENIVS